MVVQVICRSRLWAYITMAMSLFNTYFGMLCVAVITYYAIRKPEKVNADFELKTRKVCPKADQKLI